MKSNTSRKIDRFFFSFSILRFHGSGSKTLPGVTVEKHWHLEDNIRICSIFLTGKSKRFTKIYENVYKLRYFPLFTHLLMIRCQCALPGVSVELFSPAAPQSPLTIYRKPNYNGGLTWLKQGATNYKLGFFVNLSTQWTHVIIACIYLSVYSYDCYPLTSMRQ